MGPREQGRVSTTKGFLSSPTYTQQVPMEIDRFLEDIHGMSSGRKHPPASTREGHSPTWEPQGQSSTLHSLTLADCRQPCLLPGAITNTWHRPHSGPARWNELTPE